MIWHVETCNAGFFLATGSTISTLLRDKINPKNFQVLSLGDTGFLQFFRVVSRDYGKPRATMKLRDCWGESRESSKRSQDVPRHSVNSPK